MTLILKPVVWVGSSRADVREFPREARRRVGFELQARQRGEEPPDFKRMPSVGLVSTKAEFTLGAPPGFSILQSTSRRFMYSTRSKRKHKKPPDTKSFLGGSASGRSKGGDSKRPNQMPFVRGSDNVFEDVGFASGEAANLKIRADLMLDLRRFIHARRWTQAEAAALLKHIEGAPPFTILDFGCGPGRDLTAFSERGHVAIGLEGSESLAAMARVNSGGEVWEQDFMQLDLPAGRFDGVFANAALFHVPGQELPRVLKE